MPYSDLLSQENFRTLLKDADVDDSVVAASLKLDMVVQEWRRRMGKRELGRQAIVDLKLPVELAQLDVLFAIKGPVGTFGAMSDGEVIVGTVAERLSVDPSRASRLVSDVVDLGFARRAASQVDSRRTIIELTAAGEAVTSAVRAYKFLLMGTYLKDWQPQEVEMLAALMGRFGEWTDRTAADRGSKFETQLEALAHDVETRLTDAKMTA